MKGAYHFVGIGGIGMSGIAKLFLKQGACVSGSDISDTPALRDLLESGAKIYTGHNSKNVENADFVIYSSAIKEDNPEITEAKKLGKPLLKRAQALALLMKGRTVVTVAGSHGKTTTTSMVSYLLMNAGLYPSVAIGGVLRNIDTNAYSGDGNLFVAEADESDGSFLHYEPDYSIVTNIDYEHMDYYQSFDRQIASFREFINKTKPLGCVFCCGDDPNLMEVIKGYKGRRVIFGLNKSADIYPQEIIFNGLTSSFSCFVKGEHIGRFSLALAGKHNISNALSVIALGVELGIDKEIIKNTLLTYKGAKRRIDVKLDNEKYLLIDDYAHHPTEICATLSALKGIRKRLIIIFQPHRYSRTKNLIEEFGKCFSDADLVIITDIYAASENPIEGISALSVVESITRHSGRKGATFLPKKDIVKYISGIIKPGDAVITLGAGDITKVCDELVEELKRKSKA